MKYIYLKYTLLSVAITSSLLFTACGKKSEPVNETPETAQTEETTTSEEAEQDVSVYMDEDGIPEFNFKQGKVAGHEVDITDTTTQAESTGVDSTGVDSKLDEGEYQGTRPEEDGQPAESTSANTELDAVKEQAKQDMKELYDDGIISKEDYESAIAILNGEKKSIADIAREQAQQAVTPTTDPTIAEIEANAAAAMEQMETTGQGDQRTNIQYGQGDYSGLEGKYIGN